MNCGIRVRLHAVSPVLQRDLARLDGLWQDGLKRFGGPFLLGEWSIADAFYTPVATRFRTYQLDLASLGDADGAAATYYARLLATPEFLARESAAKAEAA